MHGMNENIEYNCLPGAVDFYKNLIEEMKQGGLSERWTFQ
jgi:carboxypeptidase PM20D1